VPKARSAKIMGYTVLTLFIILEKCSHGQSNLYTEKMIGFAKMIHIHCKLLSTTWD